MLLVIGSILAWRLADRVLAGDRLTRPERLERRVEMYQWQEHEESTTDKKVGGGSETTTTYTYETAWSDSPVDSSRFARSEGHENPGSFPWSQREVTAERVSLGGYRLSPGLVGKIERWQPLALSSLDPLPEDLRERARLHDGGLYFGDGAPASPKVGDVRVAFRVVEPTDVSVVAQQTGDTFRPFAAEAGGTIELLELGTVNADQMFAAAQRRNTLFTWGLRLAGFLLMAMGFAMVLRPLSVAADVLPFLGSLVGAGTGFVAFLLAGFFSLVTIAMAWIFYRPLLGGALLALAVVAVVWLVRRTRRAKAEKTRAAAPQAPPPLPPQGSPPPMPPVAG